MAPRKKAQPKPPPGNVPWANRIVGHAEVAAKSLTANPANFREHPEVQADAVGGALGRIGWIQQVIVNKTTGNMIDGHLRVQLAAKRGEKVPVTYVELTPEEERLALASFDPLSSLAIDDSAKLGALIAELDLSGDALGTFLGSHSDLASQFAFGEVGPDAEKTDKPRNLGHSTPKLAIIIAMDDVGLAERAIAATEEPNRTKAMNMIFEAFLNAKGQFNL